MRAAECSSSCAFCRLATTLLICRTAMASPSSFSGLHTEFHDESTLEFAHAAQDGRPYYGEVFSDTFSDTFSDVFSESPHRYELQSSQQSNSQSVTDIDCSPIYVGAENDFISAEEQTNYLELYPDTDSDPEAQEASQDSPYLVDHTFEHFDQPGKFNDEVISLLTYCEPVEIVGSTYSANINSKVNLKNLARTFQYLPPTTPVKKSNDIPKKISASKKEKSGTINFRNAIKFKIDLDIFGMTGFACGNVFSNGKIILSSINSDNDDLAKTILNHIAQSIQEAHFVSIANDPGAAVIQCHSYNPNYSIVPDTLTIISQLQTSVPFRIKYSRLDQAYRDGLLESAENELVATGSSKEKPSGHGYGIKYDCFSVTIYHTGKIQARTFKPHLSRSQLRNALLRVHSTLMSIQHIVEVQGDDSFDGSKRRNHSSASGKQLRTSPSPFKPLHSLF
jgi:hypothetical protein